MCKGCRRKREGRAAEKEGNGGLKVPAGTLTWHPAVKGVFGKIGGLFGRKKEGGKGEEDDDDEVSRSPSGAPSCSRRFDYDFFRSLQKE